MQGYRSLSWIILDNHGSNYDVPVNDITISNCHNHDTCNQKLHLIPMTHFTHGGLLVYTNRGRGLQCNIYWICLTVTVKASAANSNFICTLRLWTIKKIFKLFVCCWYLVNYHQWTIYHSKSNSLIDLHVYLLSRCKFWIYWVSGNTKFTT